MSAQHIFQRMKSIAVFLLLLGLIAYFSYQAVHGNHGLHRRAELKQQIGELSASLAALQAARTRLEQEISLIRPTQGQTTDLLDEQARALLNVARPDEIVIMTGLSREE